MSGAGLITNHKKGVSIATVGGVILACDVPLIRLAESDPWSAMIVRGPIMMAVLFTVFLVLKHLKLSHAKFIDGWDSLILGLLHAIATIGFVLGVYHTSTANLVFITAFSSLIAIVFSTIVLKERHPAVTWFAIVGALGGVGLITIDDFIVNGDANVFGNLMAFLCAFMLACEVVFIRRSGKNLVYATAVASVIAALFAIPFMLHNGFSLAKPEFLIANSVLIAPVAMALLALAPRYISAPETAMFYLLETVLAPILVWIIFNETITRNTFFGGMIIISAILFHSIVKLRRRTSIIVPLP